MKWKEKEKKFGKPQKGKSYLCEIQNYHTKKIIKETLIAVKEDDCLWRTADDNSEVDEWNWDVISWKLTNS